MRPDDSSAVDDGLGVTVTIAQAAVKTTILRGMQAIGTRPDDLSG